MRRHRWLVAALALVACRTAPAVRSDGTPAVDPRAPIETVAVGGAGARTRAVLARDQLYLLRASGAVTVGGRALDAEYASADGQASDAVGALDVGIDVGRKRVLPATGRKPAPPSDQRLKWFGAFRGDHVYYLIVPGTGAPLALELVAPPGPIVGAIAVAIFPLTPAPPALGDPVETVMVPAREKVAVRSATVPPPGSVYLLQAVGEVEVGGPGHMGDAEFHDYHLDGRGYNEGEAGVDFGVGVDEPTVGGDHDPRLRKWGAYRMDHTYYQLYAGTGAAIVLNYHDSGGKSGVYRDNMGSLPVSIFAAP